MADIERGAGTTYRYCTVFDECHVRVVTPNRSEVMNALHSEANHELERVWGGTRNLEVRQRHLPALPRSSLGRVGAIASPAGVAISRRTEGESDATRLRQANQSSHP